MPPADVPGGGERVSRCAHAAGFRRLGPALSSRVSPHPRYREQGCGGMSQPFRGGTKGQHSCLQLWQVPTRREP